MLQVEDASQVVARLSREGFPDRCRADVGGIRFIDQMTIYPPEKVIVKEVVRLEDDSDPNEESVVFALVSPDGRGRGTLCLSYGPGMDGIESDMIGRLPRGQPH
jgi:hypothetical protein